MGHGGKAKVRFLSDQAIKHNAFAVAVTESWLTPDVKDAELTIHIPEFSVFRSERKGRSGGGVCVFLRKDISGECLASLDNNVCSLLVIKIHSFNIVLVVVYRPPDTRISEFSPILTEIEKCLSNLPVPP